MYDILGSLFQARQNNVINSPISNGMDNLNVNDGSLSCWDPKKSGTGIEITKNGASCFLKEQSYLFRTILTKIGFTGGVNYWEIIADSRTEN
jgi:hypothetical protein